VAIDVEVQRLQLGDVVLVDLPDRETKVEAKVVRAIERTESRVLATLRVAGRDDFVQEWPLDELVTLVRGP
jgi:exoribonuclease R